VVDEHAAVCDVLCVAPHTDDAEIGCGATLRLLAERGRRVYVCDLTRGELASNATSDERWREAAAASRELDLAGRVQLALPDGFVATDDPHQTAPVVALLRSLRPRWIIVAPDPTRHPDHLAAPALVERAAFLARLAAFHPERGDERWWPQAPQLAAAAVWEAEALCVVCPDEGAPDLIFDVGATWAYKRRALGCFASQFVREPGRRPTYINSERFMERIERRGRHWGGRAGAEYGEAFCTRAVPVFTDLPAERWR
jgi:bacillithiol biosynthesis deacetylase BshB1